MPAGIRPHVAVTTAATRFDAARKGDFTVRTILLGAAAAATLAAATGAQDVTPPAGAYTLDKDHASITWRVNHLGTSTYVARFNEFDAALTFDPDDPAASTLSVTIDVTSLDLDFMNTVDPSNPDAFYNELMGIPQNTPDRIFFQAPMYPTMTFAATSIAVTDDRTGTVTGDFTMVGQTHPLTLDVRFNAVRGNLDPSGGPVIGFSATTTIQRSMWGMDTLVPYIGDDVEVAIEAEFIAEAM
jgi:polyisoprenoid-binding protein YceI